MLDPGYSAVVGIEGGHFDVTTLFRIMKRVLWLCLLLLCICCERGFGETVSSLETRCQGLERERALSLRSGDPIQINRSAGSYFESCRSIRTRDEVALAMWELALVLRMTGKLPQALKLVQDCIRFEYLGLKCHIEKAMVLNEMGMKGEAKEVLKTASDVLIRLEALGRRELIGAESSWSKIQAEEYARRVRQGNMHLWLADQSRHELLMMEKMFNGR